MTDPVPVQQSAKCETCGLAEDALCPRCERRRLHFTRPTTCDHHGFEAAPIAPSQSVEALITDHKFQSDRDTHPSICECGAGGVQHAGYEPPKAFGEPWHMVTVAEWEDVQRRLHALEKK